MAVIAYKTTCPNIIEDSEGRRIAFQTLPEALGFLDDPYPRKDKRVVWNIDYFCAPILRLLTQEQALELHNKNELYLRFDGSTGYKIRYIREKFFQVRNLARPYEDECVYYYLKQFVPDELVYTELVDLKALGEQVIKEFQALGFYPTNLTSSIAVVTPYIGTSRNLRGPDKKALPYNFPNYLDIPTDAANAFTDCGNKAWRESLKLGYFDKVTDIDLSSAFPNVHRDLWDIRQGNFIKKDGFDPTATYGACLCKVTIYPQVTVHPIIYKDRAITDSEPTLSTRTGTWEDWRPKEEVDFIRKWHIGEVDVYYGHYWYPDSKKEQRRPQRALIDRMLQAKVGASPIRKHIIKGILVGLWGKTGEYRDKANKPGVFFNPVWRSQFTSQVSMKDAEFVYRHKLMDRLIHTATDGLLFEGDVELTEEDKAKGWKVDYKGNALVITNDLVYYAEKHPNSLHINNIISMINNDLLNCRWSMPDKHILTLAEAVNRKQMDDLGTEQDCSLSIDLSRSRYTRQFRKFPVDGADLLSNVFDSKPLHF